MPHQHILKTVSIAIVFSVLLVRSYGQDLKKTAYIQVLKKELQTAQGKVKVDILNQLARLYIISDRVRADTGVMYAERAFVEAQKINYQKGLCIAASQYGKVMLQLSKPRDGIRYYRLAMTLATQIQHDSLRATSLRGIGQALWYQGYFSEAIDTIRLSVPFFERLGNRLEIADAAVTISSIYGNQGNYEKAFEFAQDALKQSLAIRDTNNTVLSLVQIGWLYKNIGDYSTALEYYKRGFVHQRNLVEWPYRYLCICMGELYADRGLYDSAWIYYRQSFSGNPGSKASRLRLARLYLAQKNYARALYHFTSLYKELKKAGEGHLSLYAALGIAEIFLVKKQYEKALHYASETLQITREKNNKLLIRDACLLLSSIYDGMNRPGLAFSFHKQYVQMNDSVITGQFKGKLFEFRRIAEDQRRQSQIELLKRETLLTQQKLKGNQLLRNILFAGILVIGLLSAIIVWNISLKRRNERLRAKSLQIEWQRTASDLEMQALRARMNPHFIFNCLSSINRFILKNETEKASDYLTRFSRLMRLVLVNSQKTFISLDEEVEMLRLYIEMERLRFKDAFTYSIGYQKDSGLSDIMVPPLLLQPFCENAIWHGLMHKEGPGHLSVQFHLVGDILQCTITDNGVGRARAAQVKPVLKEHQKSLGLQLTSARLALFNEDHDSQTSYQMEDVRDGSGNIAGTRVILKIKNRELIKPTSHN